MCNSEDHPQSASLSITADDESLSSSSRNENDANDRQQQQQQQNPYLCTYPLNINGDYVTHINGLEYYPNFLTQAEQKELIELIDSNPWQSGIIARRQQFYGQIYYHTTYKSKQLQPASTNTKILTNNNNEQDDSDENESITNTNVGISLIDSGMTKWLEKTRIFFPKGDLPKQVLINEYCNNRGISSHFEDFIAFGDLIVTISLLQPIYMTLKRPIEPTNACDTYLDIQKVLLEPGSCLIMKHDARYIYRHGIGKSKWVTIPQPTNRRTSDDIILMKKEETIQGQDQEQLSRRLQLQLEQLELQQQQQQQQKQEDSSSVQRKRICRDDTYRRASVTIRHILDTRRQVHDEEDESNTTKDPESY